jgi:glutaconate CoA-transferase, subunit A
VRDNAFYKAWDDISKDRGLFNDWMTTNVLGTDDFAGYAKSVGLVVPR